MLDPTRPDTEAPVRRATAEGAAAAAIAWAMWYLAGQDGGVDLRDAVRAMAPLLAAFPAAAIGLAGLRRRWGLVIVAACAGMVASVVFAEYRSDAVAPLLSYSAMLTVGLATVAIIRRPWGPRVLATIGVVAGARLWWLGLAAWYGSSLSSTAADRWMSLPWHNQSGIAMAALTLILIGATMGSTRWAPAAGSAAALAGAAAYLSGSRGTIAALAVGLALVLIASRQQWRRWLMLAAATAVAVLALSNLPGAADPAAGDSVAAAESSSARIAHWEAAASMFLERPTIGHGIGSYRLASVEWADGSVNPTSHAHNEFIEFFAEGGLALGIPMVLLVAGLGVAAVSALRSGGRHRLFIVTSAAVWLALAAHAFIDFDWLFPILGLGFAIVGAIVVGAAVPSPTRPPAPRWPAAIVAAVLLAALGAGFVEGFRHEPGAVHPPWNSGAAAAIAERAIEAGDGERALAIATSAAAWNPGDPRPGLIAAVVRLDSGQGTAADVVAAARAAEPGLALRLDAATQLLDRGFVIEARQLVTEAIAAFDRYSGWNLGGAAAVAYRLDVDIAGRLGGCSGARLAAEAANAVELANAMGTEDYSARAGRFCG